MADDRHGGQMDQGVGREVRRLREERGWSMAKLAVEADMSVSGVSMIENGKRNLTTTTLGKLAAAFEVEVASLFPLGQAPLPDFEDERRLYYLRAWKAQVIDTTARWLSDLEQYEGRPKMNLSLSPSLPPKEIRPRFPGGWESEVSAMCLDITIAVTDIIVEQAPVFTARERAEALEMHAALCQMGEAADRISDRVFEEFMDLPVNRYLRSEEDARSEVSEIGRIKEKIARRDESLENAKMALAA